MPVFFHAHCASARRSGDFFADEDVVPFRDAISDFGETDPGANKILDLAIQLADFMAELDGRGLVHFRNRMYFFRKLENFGRREPVVVEDYSIEHIIPHHCKGMIPGFRMFKGDLWRAESYPPKVSRIQGETQRPIYTRFTSLDITSWRGPVFLF